MQMTDNLRMRSVPRRCSYAPATSVTGATAPFVLPVSTPQLGPPVLCAGGCRLLALHR